jgi:hypothetical protein
MSYHIKVLIEYTQLNSLKTHFLNKLLMSTRLGSLVCEFKLSFLSTR